MPQYGHYIFPDPGLFIHPATAGRYIESWLWVHDTWFMHVAKEPSLAMSNQSWHTFLSMDISVLEKGETKAAHRRQEALGKLLPNLNMYLGVEKWSSLMGPIVWQGKEYPSGVLPPENVIQEILWELYEANFIHELQSLDHCACNNLDLSSTNKLYERRVEISSQACFNMSLFPLKTLDWLTMTLTSVSVSSLHWSSSWIHGKERNLLCWLAVSSIWNCLLMVPWNWRKFLQNITVNNSSIISDVQLRFLTTFLQWILANFDYTGPSLPF